MMRRKFTKSVLLFSSMLVLGVGGVAVADDDDHRGGFFSKFIGSKSIKRGVAPVNNPQYREECGACHFAYQPGLLPARSWRRVMAGLEEHFGENAELPKEDARVLKDYLVKNAAEHSNYKRSVKIMRTLSSNDAPLRTTDTPYITRKHRGLSPRQVVDNPEVVSISNCDACHTQAVRGSFSERGIDIPGFGRWEDD
ncbi:MAG: diheme cytochrome c [Candidatus Sedimenticola sp. (ex Thyasira tokunagai)]